MADERTQRPERDEDASFDALLANAAWPELSADAQARLRAAIATPEPWRAAVPAAVGVPRQRHGATSFSAFNRTLRRTALAVAAAIAIGVVGLEAVRHVTSKVPSRRPDGPSESIAVNVAPTPPSRVVPSSIGRPANVYERVVVASARLERTRAAALAKRLAVPAVAGSVAPLPADDVAALRRAAARPASRDAAVARLATRDDPPSVDLVLQLVSDPGTRGAMLGALRRSTPRPSTDLLADRLIARLAGPKVADRFAAAKALGTLDDAATLSRLARMAQSNDHRREALAALLSSDAPGARATLDRLVRTDPNIAPHVAAVRGELRTLYS